MADQRTEKPTQRRLDRARKEGNFPASREFVGAVHFITVVALVSLFTAGFFSRLLLLSRRRLFAFAFTGSLSARQVVALARNLIAPDFLPLIFGGLTLTVVVIAIQLGTTKLGISPQKLAPDFKRLNPLPKLTGSPGGPKEKPSAVILRATAVRKAQADAIRATVEQEFIKKFKLAMPTGGGGVHRRREGCRSPYLVGLHGRDHRGHHAQREERLLGTGLRH